MVLSAEKETWPLLFSSASSLTSAETRSLSLSKGPRSFVRNELRIWKPTLNGIYCLTSLKHKRRNNVWIVNMYLKNLRLRFRLVKICNKKLCSPPQERTVAHASGSERSVFLSWLIFCFFCLPCLFFCLFHEIPCHSVANMYSASAFLPLRGLSVFAVKMLCFF